MTACSFLWGRICHHVEREASRFHPIYALEASAMATEETTRAFLRDMNARIVDGPSPAGFYVAEVVLRKETRPDEVVAGFERQDIVRLAERARP